MEGKCSFSELAKSSYGEFRGSTRMMCRLRECQEGITGYLQACHLSKLTGIPEYELLLARAGLFDVPLHRQEETFVCPKHRYNLGHNWRPLRTCQYPLHSRARKKLRNRNVVNMQMSKNIQSVFGTTIPVGSGEWFVHFYFVVRGYSLKTDEIVHK